MNNFLNLNGKLIAKDVIATIVEVTADSDASYYAAGYRTLLEYKDGSQRYVSDEYAAVKAQIVGVREPTTDQLSCKYCNGCGYSNPQAGVVCSSCGGSGMDLETGKAKPVGKVTPKQLLEIGFRNIPNKPTDIQAVLDGRRCALLDDDDLQRICNWLNGQT